MDRLLRRLLVHEANVLLYNELVHTTRQHWGFYTDRAVTPSTGCFAVLQCFCSSIRVSMSAQQARSYIQICAL
jgi:hypothetical protein